MHRENLTAHSLVTFIQKQIIDVETDTGQRLDAITVPMRDYREIERFCLVYGSNLKWDYAANGGVSILGVEILPHDWPITVAELHETPWCEPSGAQAYETPDRRAA